MKAKMSAYIKVAIIFIMISSLKVVAQHDSTNPLIGVWRSFREEVAETEGSFMQIGFYPEGKFFALIWGGFQEGSYTITDSQIEMIGTEYYADQVYEFALVGIYEIINNNLMILSDDFNMDFQLLTPFMPTNEEICAGNITSSKMQVGFFGQVTYTDGSPTPLRSGPSRDETLLLEMPEGMKFVVIGGPICAGDFTWWQIRPIHSSHIGWSAEGSRINAGVYFIEPLPEMLEVFASSSQSPTQVVSCNTLPTNLYIGATAKVAFFSGLSPLPVFVEPNQNAAITSDRLSEGSTVSILSGPICADGVLWWQVARETIQGWVPEVTSSSRLLLRVTDNPNDLSAVYDPLMSIDEIYIFETQRILKVYANAYIPSTVKTTIGPGVAYKLLGSNMSEPGMYLIGLSETLEPIGWICGDPQYLRVVFPRDRISSPLPQMSDSTYTCTWEDYYYTSEEVFEISGATVYQPGQYPHLQSLETAIIETPAASTLLIMVEHVLFVREVVHREVGRREAGPIDRGIDLICTLLDVQSLGNTDFEALPSVTDANVACVLFDLGSNVIKGDPLVGTMFMFAEVFANPDQYIDPWLNGINSFFDSYPLTRLYCRLRPGNCIGQ